VTTIVTSNYEYHLSYQPITDDQPIIQPVTISITDIASSTNYTQIHSHGYKNHHQTMYIKNKLEIVLYHASIVYHTKYINMYHTMYQPCTKTCTIPCINHVLKLVPYHVHQPIPYHASTMYHTKYTNHVPYHIHQPCIKPQHVPTLPRHAPHRCTNNMPHTMHQRCVTPLFPPSCN
jgi:hypothetical protein